MTWLLMRVAMASVAVLMPVSVTPMTMPVVMPVTSVAVSVTSMAVSVPGVAVSVPYAAVEKGVAMAVTYGGKISPIRWQYLHFITLSQNSGPV